MKYIVSYTYTTYMRVTFDGKFVCKLGGMNMNDAASIVAEYMTTHNFEHADVVDDDTGEVLIIIDRETKI